MSVGKWYDRQTPRVRALFVLAVTAGFLYAIHLVGGDPGFPLER